MKPDRDKVTSKGISLKTAFYLAAVLLMIAGVGTASFFYFTGQSDPDSDFGYDAASGYISRMNPGDSKMYRHDVELYGGKAILIADDFRRWFEGLWHGKSLGVTLACFCIFISLALFLVANRLPSDIRSAIGKD